MHDGSAARPELAALERRFTELTHLLYDTGVTLDVLDERVLPAIADDVEFVDPWVHVRGKRPFTAGLRGFHCVIRFDFTIHQLTVDIDEDGRRGRALVDGIMNLRQLVVYTYPLRTILVYEFSLAGDPPRPMIHRIEEMWSLGDLVANLPVIGRIYDSRRWGWGALFVALFRASCAVATRLRPRLLGAPEADV